MPNYIINRNKDLKGHNEVHTTFCNYLPESENRVSLGYFNNAKDAVKYAKSNGWYSADGCYYCCNEAHTG